MKGGDVGASTRAPLGSGRSEEEKRGGNDRWVLHPDKYLGVAWADRPPLPSELSARLDVTRPPLYFEVTSRDTISERDKPTTMHHYHHDHHFWTSPTLMQKQSTCYISSKKFSISP